VWSKTRLLEESACWSRIEFIAGDAWTVNIRSDAEVYEVLTDYEAVRLAEELGSVWLHSSIASTADAGSCRPLCQSSDECPTKMR